MYAWLHYFLGSVQWQKHKVWGIIIMCVDWYSYCVSNSIRLILFLTSKPKSPLRCIQFHYHRTNVDIVLQSFICVPYTGGRCRKWSKGNCHLRSCPTAETIPENPSPSGKRTGEKVQRETHCFHSSGNCLLIYFLLWLIICNFQVSHDSITNNYFIIKALSVGITLVLSTMLHYEWLFFIRTRPCTAGPRIKSFNCWWE